MSEAQDQEHKVAVLHMTETATCKHFWIRYVLDDSESSHTQRDGVDDRGRPYRDVPMKPMEVFAYAATIGSSFASRVVEAICRDCDVKIIDELPREEISSPREVGSLAQLLKVAAHSVMEDS